MDKQYSVLNNLNFSIILFDRTLSLDFINPSAQELTGISDRFVKNIKAEEFFANNPYIYEKINDVFENGEGFIDFEYEFINRNLVKRFVLLEISRISTGNSSYISVTMRDVTRFKEMESHVKDKEKLQDLSGFIAEMSHEIRNPLGGVKAAAAYMKKKIDEAGKAHPVDFRNFNNFLEIIIKETGRINSLMEDLLSLSKKHKLRTEKVNINKVINEILMLQTKVMDDNNITVVKEFDPSLPYIYGSRNALKQVFLNAIRNAFDAVLEGRSSGRDIKIATKIDSARNSPKFIKIDFIDNGSGIKKSDMKKLFVPFFTTKEKGSGLGLAVSRKIVYEHNGFIEIKSEKGSGTAVSFYLPVTRKLKSSRSGR